MKLKIYIAVLTAVLVLMSCTPELEDDYVRIDFSDNTEFRLYGPDTSYAAHVKVNYHAFPSRNGVSLGEVTYTGNVLFGKKTGEIWRYVNTLNSDSFLTVVKRTGEMIYLSVENNEDTLFYSADIITGLVSELTEFDSTAALEYGQCDSISAEAIKSLRKYKPYNQWKDEIINLYR